MTDANGNYSFTNVGPGTYTVQEELQSGWIQTFPAPPGTYTVAATSGSDQPGHTSATSSFVTFAGTVYSDLSGNGVIDPGDPGLQGWTVNLLDQHAAISWRPPRARRTGPTRSPTFGPGTYTIEEVTQSGWYQTQPVNSSGNYTVPAISSTNPSRSRLWQLPARERHRQRLQRPEP